MKDAIKPGLETTAAYIVDAARVTRHMGEDLGVYATPALLRDIEHTCHDLLQEHLDEGEDSVGTRIDMQHLAATLEGVKVTLAVRVTKVDRRAVTLEFTASDEFDELARGTHSRFVVDKTRLRQRLADKADRIKGKR